MLQILILNQVVNLTDFIIGSDSTGDYMLISPEITELTTDGIQVSFSVKGEAGQDLEIGTMSDPS